MAPSESASIRPSDARSIGDIIDFWDGLHAEHAALIFLDDSGQEQVTSYGQLRKEATALAAELLNVCEPGDRAILIFPPGKEFVTAFLGCLYAGVLAVPATEPKPRRPNDRLSAVAEDCSPRVVLCKREVLDRIEIAIVCPRLADVSWICVDEPREPAPPQSAIERDAARIGSPTPLPTPLPTIGASALAFLQYTSGSTSDPKGVAISHSNLLHNLEMIRHGFGRHFNFESDPKMLGVFWLPPHHDMGLIGGILTPLYLGGTTVVMSPTSFLKRPLKWLEAISKYRGLISGAPNFAYELCVQQLRKSPPQLLDLSCWDIAFCGAEPIRADTIDRFCEAFEPYGFRRESFYPCYGMAEATLLVSGNVGRRAPTIKVVDKVALQNHRVQEASSGAPASEASNSAGLEAAGDTARLVGCGGPMLTGEILIVDPATREPSAADEVGEIWYRSESVAQGYWNRPALSKKAFRAPLASGQGGHYLRTGDMGFIDDGQLYVTGRLKEMLVIRGRNLYPQDLEATATAADPSLPSSSAAAFSIEIDGFEQLVLAQELDRNQKESNYDDLIRRLRTALIQSYDVSPAAVLLVRPFSLPRTTSGKMQRILCRQLYLEGQLKVLAEWKPQPIPAEPPPSEPSRPLSLFSDQMSQTQQMVGAGDFADAGDAAAERSLEAKISHMAEEIEHWLLIWLTAHGTVSGDEITPDRPLAEFGLDSLTAVELATQIEERYDLTLNPIIVWNYPTPRHLARYLAGQIHEGFRTAAPAANGARPNSRFEMILREIEELDDREVLQRLGHFSSVRDERPQNA